MATGLGPGYNETLASNDQAGYFQTNMAASLYKNGGWAVMADLASRFGALYTATGSGNAQVVTQTRKFSSLVTGLELIFLPVAQNTGATTLAVDGLAAKNIYYAGTALNGGELKTGVPAYVKYDGTQWNLINTASATLQALNTSTGSANAQALAQTVPFNALASGRQVVFIPGFVNTGAATLNVDGLGAKNIYAYGAALKGGELQTLTPAFVEYDGTQWNLLNPVPYAATPTVITSGGSANAQTVTQTTRKFYTLTAGQQLAFVPGFANTGPATLAVDGLTATNIYANNLPLAGGELQTSTVALVEYDGTKWNLLNPAVPGRNYFADPCCRVAQNVASTPVTLTTAGKYGSVDLVKCYASGTAVSAGTIVQDTVWTVGTAATSYSCKIAGATITGTGKVFFQRWLDTADTVSMNSKTVLFSVKCRHDVGSNINAFLTLKKGATTLATGSTVSVTSATDTIITLAYTMASTDGNSGLTLILELDPGAITTKNFYATDWQACIGTLQQVPVVPNFNDDLLYCQRYYEQSEPYGSNWYSNNEGIYVRAGAAWANAAIIRDSFPRLKFEKSTSAVTISGGTVSGGQIYDFTGAAYKNITINIFNSYYEIVNNSGAGLTAGNIYRWSYAADARP